MDDSRYMVIEVGISWQQFPWGSWSTRKGKSAKSGTKEECFSASDHCLPNDFASFACLCARPKRIYLNWTLLQWSIIYICIISGYHNWCTVMHPEIIKKMLPTSVNAIMVSLHDFMEFGLEFSKSLPQAHLLKASSFGHFQCLNSSRFFWPSLPSATISMSFWALTIAQTTLATFLWGSCVEMWPPRPLVALGNPFG